VSFLTNIFTSWNLSKELPKLAVIGGLCFVLGYCNSSTKTVNTTTTEYRDTALGDLDSLLKLLAVRPTKIINRETIRTIIIQAQDTVSNIAYSEDSTDYPPDSEIIDIVEGVRDEIAGIEPIQPERFGFRLDAMFGPSLPGGTMFGAQARLWLDRWSLFAMPRLVVPDFSRSSVDIGVGFRVF
jgi:hypothetical protein